MKTQTTRWHQKTWARYARSWTSTAVAVWLAFCAVCANAEPEVIIGSGAVQITKNGNTIEATGAITYSSTNAPDVFIAAVTAFGGAGGTVSVGAGTYVFNKTVNLTGRKVRVEGVGDNTVIDTRVPVGVWGAAFNMRTNHLEIRNLKISGLNSSSSDASPCLIAFHNKDAGFNYVFVDNVTFDTLPEGRGNFIRATGVNTINKLVVKNSRFYVNRTYPPGTGPVGNACILVGTRNRNAWVRDNTIVGDSGLTTNAGIDIWQCEDSIRVFDNYIENVRVGVGVAKTENGNYISDLRYVYIERNVIDRTYWDGVHITSGRSIIVDENCLKNAGRNGVWVGKRVLADGTTVWPTDVYVTYNHIVNSAGADIFVYSKAVPTTYLEGNDNAPCP